MTVKVYSKPRCSACENTKRKLTRLGVSYEEHSLADTPEILEKAVASGFRAAPIVVADGVMWGGFDEAKIEALVDSGDTWDF